MVRDKVRLQVKSSQDQVKVKVSWGQFKVISKSRRRRSLVQDKVNLRCGSLSGACGHTIQVEICERGVGPLKLIIQWDENYLLWNWYWDRSHHKWQVVQLRLLVLRQKHGVSYQDRVKGRYIVQSTSMILGLVQGTALWSHGGDQGSGS